MADTVIVGAHEAAAILGISPPTFSHLRARAKQKEETDFPTPMIELKCGPVWRKRDIERFAKVYKPVVRAKPGEAKAKAKNEAEVVDISTAKSAKAAPKKTAAKKVAAPVKKLAVKGLAKKTAARR